LDKTKNLPLLEHVQKLLELAKGQGSAPRIIITGSTGRAGSGALTFARSLKLDVTEWDSTDTKHKGPFPELLSYDIMIHAVRLSPHDDGQPFLTQELIRTSPRRLSVIVDISCDINSPRNKLPIHSSCTTFEKPVARVLGKTDNALPLDVIAIPNLPTLLPKESSLIFSQQLLACLLQLAEDGWAAPVWQRCLGAFEQTAMAIRPSPSPLFTGEASAPFTATQKHIAASLAGGTITQSLLAPR
jgi:saccharopine dehydrogenase (NAD+, L-lysine-forming)